MLPYSVRVKEYSQSIARRGEVPRHVLGPVVPGEPPSEDALAVNQVEYRRVFRIGTDVKVGETDVDHVTGGSRDLPKTGPLKNKYRKN